MVGITCQATDMSVRLGEFLWRWIFIVGIFLQPWGVVGQVIAPLKAESPVLVTSSGQSLDGFTTKTLLTRAGIANDYKALATGADLEKVKTLIIAFGASVKGFGAAGITIDTEIARTTNLLTVARAKKIRIIGMHLGGAERRTGMSKEIVEIVAPACDWLIVWEDGNGDGYFSKLSTEKKIPLNLLKQPMEAGRTIAMAFK